LSTSRGCLRQRAPEQVLERQQRMPRIEEHDREALVQLPREVQLEVVRDGVHGVEGLAHAQLLGEQLPRQAQPAQQLRTPGQRRIAREADQLVQRAVVRHVQRLGLPAEKRAQRLEHLALARGEDGQRQLDRRGTGHGDDGCVHGDELLWDDTGGIACETPPPRRSAALQAAAGARHAPSTQSARRALNARTRG
jgi:hypothetical protein